MASLRATVQEIGLVFKLLEASNIEAVIAGERDDLLSRLLSLLDNLPSAEDLAQLLTSYALPQDQRYQGQQDIVNTITKLRKYRASCIFLWKAARATTIFRSITVAEVLIQRSPNTRGKSPSLAMCLERMDLAWKRGMSKSTKKTLSDLSEQFQSEMRNLKPKIHAEIQLVFFYEQYDDLRKPRIICSSKSACFLCNLFIRLHGKFLVRKTHGVLYSKWTLPAVEEVSLRSEAEQAMRRLLDQFRVEIRREIRKSMRGAAPKRTHPTESLFSLQVWSDSDKSFIALSPAGAENTTGNIFDTVGQDLTPAIQLLRDNDVEADADETYRFVQPNHT